jgi:hypothetical protein
MNNTTFLDRLIKGVKNGTSLRPTIIPETISSIFMGNNTNNINSNNNYHDLKNHLNQPIEPFQSEFKTDSNNSEFNDKEFLNSEIQNMEEKKPLGNRRREDNQEYHMNKEKESQNDMYERKSGINNWKNNEQDVIDKVLEKKEINARNSSFLEKEKSILSGSQKIEKEKSILSGSQKIEKEITALKSDKLDYKININPKNKIKDINANRQQISFSKDSEIENDLLSGYLFQRLKKNEIIKKNLETTITINIGKITVRAGNNKPYNSINVNQSKRLSLNDYLRKRSETNKHE